MLDIQFGAMSGIELARRLAAVGEKRETGSKTSGTLTRWGHQHISAVGPENNLGVLLSAKPCDYRVCRDRLRRGILGNWFKVN